jgi:hypothetical protein
MSSLQAPVIAISGIDFEGELAQRAGARAVFAARASLLESQFGPRCSRRGVQAS